MERKDEMEDLILWSPDVDVTIGTVRFDGYKKLKSEAEDLARHIETIEVTEENVKEVKRLLAQVNKSVKRLNDERISIKKRLNEPYDEFASKVKDIETIVKSADELVRQQVRDLEEQEREEKKKELLKVWNLRIQHYGNGKLFTFEDWLKPNFLNKTFSLGQAESIMVEFLEQVERDVSLIRSMDNSEDILYFYKEFIDLGQAIDTVRAREEEKKRQEEVLSSVTEEEVPEVKDFVFRVFDEKDAKLVEYLLTDNSIEFEKL